MVEREGLPLLQVYYTQKINEMEIQVSKESTGIVNFEDLERGFRIMEAYKAGKIAGKESVRKNMLQSDRRKRSKNEKN